MRALAYIGIICICCLLIGCPVDPERAKLTSGQTEAKVPATPSSLTFITSFGGYGEGEGLFSRIGGLAAHDGRLYVGDQVLSRVQVFDYFGNYLDSWGCGLNTKKQGVDEETFSLKLDASESELIAPSVVQAIRDRNFFRPFDIDIYEGDVLVLNNLYSRAEQNLAIMTPEILRFTPEGKLVSQQKISLLLPGFFSVDEANQRVVISDFLNNAFTVFDLETGDLLGSSRKAMELGYRYYLEQVYSAPNPELRTQRHKEWTRAGSADGQFDFIAGVDFYSARTEDGGTVDMVLAVDMNNNRLQIFTVEGKHLKSIVGAAPGRRSLIVRPTDVAITDEGIVHISDQDPRSPGVAVFTSKFDLLYKLVHPQMRSPTNIELTPEGFIFVADGSSNRIFVFGPKEAKLAAEKEASTTSGDEDGAPSSGEEAPEGSSSP